MRTSIRIETVAAAFVALISIVPAVHAENDGTSESQPGGGAPSSAIDGGSATKPADRNAAGASKPESFSHWSPTLSGGIAGQAGSKTKNGWFMVDGFYTPYKHMSGGGGAVAGEWIHPDLNLGLGGRVGMSFLSGDDGDFEIKNDTLNLDIHAPIRIASWLIVYAGAGLSAFDMEYSYTIPGTFRYQRNGGYYTKNGKKITYVSDKPSSITTVYAGLRFLLGESFYVFGEFHKDTGSITMSATSSYFRGGGDSMKADMDASRFVVGAGFMF